MAHAWRQAGGKRSWAGADSPSEYSGAAHSSATDGAVAASCIIPASPTKRSRLAASSSSGGCDCSTTLGAPALPPSRVFCMLEREAAHTTRGIIAPADSSSLGSPNWQTSSSTRSPLLLRVMPLASSGGSGCTAGDAMASVAAGGMDWQPPLRGGSVGGGGSSSGLMRTSSAPELAEQLCVGDSPGWAHAAGTGTGVGVQLLQTHLNHWVT